MCIQLVERYSVCKCLYYRHAVDECQSGSPQRHHKIQERTILVGSCCPNHAQRFNRLSEGSSLSTPTLFSDAESNGESISSRFSGSTLCQSGTTLLPDNSGQTEELPIVPTEDLTKSSPYVVTIGTNGRARQRSSPGQSPHASQGTPRHSSVSGVNARKRDKPLPPITVRDPTDTVELKRARNTAAARESRQKKVERVEELEKQVEELQSQVEHWRSISLARVGDESKLRIAAERTAAATPTAWSSISPDFIVNELYTSLIQDPNLKSLWPVLVHSITLKSAEKHLLRFFKSYSRNLQKAAKNDLERRASQLVKTLAPFLSGEICRHYSALESQQMAPLSSLPDEKGDESDSETSEKSEPEDIDQSTIPQFEPVRRFLFEGPPLKCLQSNLENLIHRAQEPIHLQIHQRVRIRIQNLLSPWVSSKLKEGSTRLWWTCCCGLRSYDDYTELLPGGLEGLRIQLDSMATTGHVEAVTNNRSRSRPSSSILSNMSAFLARLVPQEKKSSLPQHRPTAPQTGIEQCHVDSQPSNQNHNFLLLCLPFMQLAFTVQHADVCRLQSDRQFFQLLRQRYTDFRGHLCSIFSLQKLTALHFAQFEIYRSQNLADVRHVPSIPPTHLKTEYDYLPMPAEFIPPVGSNLLLHLYEHPDHAEGTDVLFRKVPKKLRCRLEACPVKGSNVGWGIQFIEGLHWPKLLLYSCCGFGVSFVVGVVWAAVRDDVQGGFGIAGVLLAFMVLVVSLVQAGLNRSKETRWLCF